MNSGRFLSRRTVSSLSKLNARLLPSQGSCYRCIATTTPSASPWQLSRLGNCSGSSFSCSDRFPRARQTLARYIHASQNVYDGSNHVTNDVESDSENDETMNDFLSRFVWIMRKRLRVAYPDCDRDIINQMLLIIVEKVVAEVEKGGLDQIMGANASTPSQDFSEDLWLTVWEVSNLVLKDMEKEKKKEKMKSFLQHEEVKEKYRFAGEIGIRGDMLRELRFKWAREKMEESEFYESLERAGKVEEDKREPQEIEVSGNEVVGSGDSVELKTVSLPKRHGKINYKIYGLDLSSQKWAEVARKIDEGSETMWAQEAKVMSGKSKLVTDSILSLQEGEDPSPLLGNWKALVEPRRIDWITLLDRLKEHNSPLFFKISELALGEESFQANVRDYSKLIDDLARENRIVDAEKILNTMNEKGIVPDAIALAVLVHMYCKSGNLDRAKEAFERLSSFGYQPDLKVYNSMIMAYVDAGKPELASSVLKDMDNRDAKPTKEIYMALLRSFAHRGDATAAERMFTNMQFSGYQPSPEMCTLMVEAYGQAKKPDTAREYFDHILKLGHKPEDKCIASMIAAYGKQNHLDKALNFLLELEKDGLEPGVATYTVLVDWLVKLKLFDEAEQIVDKIAELGESPPFEIHVSLCEMYSRNGDEKKALQALGVLESKSELLAHDQFERVISSLIAGGFVEDAQRLRGSMEARGFALSDGPKIAMMASQAVEKHKTLKPWGFRRNH